MDTPIKDNYNTSEAQFAERPDADIFCELILQESGNLGRSLLLCRTLGRFLFVSIILMEHSVIYIDRHWVSFVDAILLLCALWIFESLIISWRRRAISRMIGENLYEYSPRWGPLFIRAHWFRYDHLPGKLFAILIFGEPALWAMVALLAPR